MFALVKGVYGEITKREEYFISILGLDSAGKSVYLERLKRLLDKTHKERDISEIQSTVGLNHVKIQINEFIVNFWDLGGQLELRSLWNSYLDECSAIVFLVDSTDTSRLDEITSSWEQIMSVEHVHTIPFLILLNKYDLAEEHPKVNGNAVEKETIDGFATTTMSFIDWQSFELEHDNDWEIQSNCSSTKIASNTMMERIRCEFENRFGSIHQGDFAIISISALKNTNIKKSVNWLINALTSYKKELINR